MKARLAAAAAVSVLAAAGVLVSKWEGKHNAAYLDPIGIPTVCYGHTGPEVKLGQSYTDAQCMALLEADLLEAQQVVDQCIPETREPHQTAALISATFNVGPRVVCGSTLQRLAKAGDWAGACAELDRWKYAGGRVYRGLVLRRADERALCEGRL
ncbi:MAG: lysozyme [Pseudoxanthomonas sp.]|nr:lysozyme [Pseudoxanthomonas sp.]